MALARKGHVLPGGTRSVRIGLPDLVDAVVLARLGLIRGVERAVGCRRVQDHLVPVAQQVKAPFPAAGAGGESRLRRPAAGVILEPVQIIIRERVAQIPPLARPHIVGGQSVRRLGQRNGVCVRRPQEANVHSLPSARFTDSASLEATDSSGHLRSSKICRYQTEVPQRSYHRLPWSSSHLLRLCPVLIQSNTYTPQM